MENSLDPLGWPERGIRPSSCLECRNSLSCSHRIRARSSRHRGRRQHQAIGNAPDRQCPRAVKVSLDHLLNMVSTHLHGHQPVVDQYFLGQKIGTDGGFVAGAKLLIDL
ncbi:hypothetical protein IG631_07257 [Alternaria alternata]|nr:hypothetical protein IG631_07257 [Alternaria alternata]